MNKRIKISLLSTIPALALVGGVILALPNQKDQVAPTTPANAQVESIEKTPVVTAETTPVEEVTPVATQQPVPAPEPAPKTYEEVRAETINLVRIEQGEQQSLCFTSIVTRLEERADYYSWQNTPERMTALKSDIEKYYSGVCGPWQLMSNGAQRLHGIYDRISN